MTEHYLRKLLALSYELKQPLILDNGYLKLGNVISPYYSTAYPLEDCLERAYDVFIKHYAKTGLL